MIKELVVFDLDGTIIDMDCAQEWLSFLRQQQITGVEPAFDACEQHMHSYDNGSMDMTAYMEDWLAPILNEPLDKIQRWAREFAQQQVLKTTFDEALKHIRQHQEAGATVLIVSASPEFLVKAIAATLEVEHAIGIVVENKDEYLLTTLKQPMSFKQGKVAAIYNWLMEQKYDYAKIDLAFSDSINDLPLLAAAEDAVCVNPDKRLLEVATTLGWQVVNWR